MTLFQETILCIMRTIPPGRVMSYGQIAAYTGNPRAARQVGWAMRRIDSPDFPWWRVVNNTGRISIKGNPTASATQQKALLEAEGVVVSPDFTLDMSIYRHVLTLDMLHDLRISDDCSQLAADSTRL